VTKLYIIKEEILLDFLLAYRPAWWMYKVCLYICCGFKFLNLLMGCYEIGNETNPPRERVAMWCNRETYYAIKYLSFLKREL